MNEAQHHSTSKSRHWVIVLNWLTLGGAERQALHLADELMARGDRVSVVGLSTPGVVQHMCEERGIPCYHWPFYFAESHLKKVKMIWDLARKIRSLKPDFIAPYDMVPNLLCGLFWKWTGAQGFVWQQRDEGRTRRARVLERAALKRTPAFISNSNHAVDWLVHELGVERQKTNVIRNGVILPDLNQFESGRWKSRNGIDPRKRLVSMVANIHHYKDHMTLVRAWKLVLDEFDDYEDLLLVLAGNKQSTWAEVEEYLHAHDLQKFVFAPGGISDVPDLLFDTELIAFSSLNEGVPNGILEGMAHGRPVVGTAIPGIVETGIGHDAHQLFPGKDARSCADQILHFLWNPEDALRAGQQNRMIIERDFGVRRMVDETVRVFESVAKGRR